MLDKDVVNGGFRQAGDVCVDHLPSELAVTDIGMKLSVLDDGSHFFWQYLAVVYRSSGLGLKQVAALIEPSVVGALLDAV